MREVFLLLLKFYVQLLVAMIDLKSTYSEEIIVAHYRKDAPFVSSAPLDYLVALMIMPGS